MEFLLWVVAYLVIGMCFAAVGLRLKWFRDSDDGDRFLAILGWLPMLLLMACYWVPGMLAGESTRKKKP